MAPAWSGCSGSFSSSVEPDVRVACGALQQQCGFCGARLSLGSGGSSDCWCRSCLLVVLSQFGEYKFQGACSVHISSLHTSESHASETTEPVSRALSAHKPKFSLFVQEWNDRWKGYKEAGIQPGFHKSDVNPRLEEHYHTLFGDKQVTNSPAARASHPAFSH